MPAVAERRGVTLVDGTARECTGVIAALETAFRTMEDGTTVHALVADVPSRVEVHAWAERKGHAIPEEAREAGRFRLTIVKGGRRRPARSISPGVGAGHDDAGLAADRQGT